PLLSRKVLRCEELGGEAVTCNQSDSGLLIKLRQDKLRGVHSVVKLTLADGPALELIDVEGVAAKQQHGTLVNPMGHKDN
ncbi:hypothetical protein P4B35_24100, partial [Pontiellaceae bacterium B12227]|nr:hypothetical protein [Pontiellaceae bacterium B12227]